MGDAGNKGMSATVGCEDSNFKLGKFCIMVGVNGGYVAFVVMI